VLAKHKGETINVRKYFFEAAQVANISGDQEMEGSCLWELIPHLLELGNTNAAIDTCNRALECFRAIQHPHAAVAEEVLRRIGPKQPPKTKSL